MKILTILNLLIILFFVFLIISKFDFIVNLNMQDFRIVEKLHQRQQSI